MLCIMLVTLQPKVQFFLILQNNFNNTNLCFKKV